MKNCMKWLRRILISLLVTIGLAPFLGLLFGFVSIALWGIDFRDERAAAALESTGLHAYTQYAPYHCTTVDDCMTIFEIAEYDNHVDNTNLRAGLMALAAETDSWHVEPVTVADYAARIPAEAAFLLPDVTFDAWFESPEDLAFFDQETGLFVHLREGEIPKSGSVRVDRLSIPHSGFVYEMETHGGFHGDGSTFQALIVPESKRAALESALSAHADWYEGSVTAAEYVRLHERFHDVPPFYPAADVTFDRWCWADAYARQYPETDKAVWGTEDFPAVMQEAGAGCSGNWLCALYDSDSGLFIFYQYDS